MPDREKVIRWLECCGDYDEQLNHVGCTEKCPYYANSLSCDPVAPFQDALKLLKEQEVLLKRAYELLADVDLDLFCEDLICNDGWCDDHCTTNGTTPECIERWLRKQISEGR